MTDSVTRSVVVEREFPHPAEKIWRALTQAPLIAEWLAENDFQPVLGHRFTLRAPPNPQWNGITDCEVLVIEPLKRSVVPFVEPPVGDHRQPHSVHLLDDQPGGADGPAEHRDVNAVEPIRFSSSWGIGRFLGTALGTAREV